MLISRRGDSPAAEGRHLGADPPAQYMKGFLGSCSIAEKRTLGATVCRIHRYEVNTVWGTGEVDNRSSINANDEQRDNANEPVYE